MLTPESYVVSKPKLQNVKDEGLPTCFFATDLHGQTDRYDKLLASIIRDRPAAVFLGGDLLPRSAFSAIQSGQADFLHDYLVPTFTRTRDALGADYPDIFLILGNDDPRCEEEGFVAASAEWPLALRPRAEISLGRVSDLWPCLCSADPVLAEGLGALRCFPVRPAGLCLSGGGP